MNKQTTNTQQYIPGVCNIGPAERRKRRMSGIIGLVFSVVLAVVFFLLDLAWPWYLILILPLTGSASGFLQDAMHFCAGFGMQGLYNVINSAGITDNVELEEYRQKDRRKALQILGLSLAIGIVVTGLVILAIVTLT